jgi:hypothetical protein
LRLNSAELGQPGRDALTIPGKLAGLARPDPPNQERKPMAVTGYCLKCKKNTEIKDAQAITMKNGKPATTGTCPVCGTKIFKIGKA